MRYPNFNFFLVFICLWTGWRMQRLRDRRLLASFSVFLWGLFWLSPTWLASSCINNSYFIWHHSWLLNLNFQLRFDAFAFNLVFFFFHFNTLVNQGFIFLHQFLNGSFFHMSDLISFKIKVKCFLSSFLNSTFWFFKSRKRTLFFLFFLLLLISQFS